MGDTIGLFALDLIDTRAAEHVHMLIAGAIRPLVAGAVTGKRIAAGGPEQTDPT